MSNQTLTGYPSIDKPWLKYVNLERLNQVRPLHTIYEEIKTNNQNNQDNIALEFFGTKIKFKKLFDKIDEYSKAFVSTGVKKGTFVTICCAGIPEVVYSFYALAKIGAVANFMSPFFDSDQMVDRINDCESKLMLVMDSFYPLIKDSIKKSCIEKTVILPTLNSSVLRLLKPKPKIQDNGVISLKSFLKQTVHCCEVITQKYEPNLPLALVYSSGTTGASKAIVLSHDSFQNSIHSYEACGINLDSNQKFYQIIPPWFSTGSSTSIHLPLSNGITVFMDPRFDRNIFVTNICKHKITTTVAPTSMYEGFLDADLVKDYDLSFLSNPFQGGEPLKKELKEAIEKVFREHGSSTALKIGYGQCECGAGIATQTDDFYRSDGSVGIPIPGVICAIMDENKNELSYNERGEILVCTKSGMIEYYKDKKSTEEYFYTDNDGVKWSCTGDIGCIDEDGNLFVHGRKHDFTIVNGKKIYNFDIENIIIKNSKVKNVDVLSKNGNGNNFVVHLILTDSIEPTEQLSKQIINEIQELIYQEFKDLDYVPEWFKIRTDFPYAKSGKRNTGAIEQEIDGFVFCDKNNMSI